MYVVIDYKLLDLCLLFSKNIDVMNYKFCKN